MKVLQLLYAGLGGHGSVAFSLISADVDRIWKSMLGFVGVEPLLATYDILCTNYGIDFKYFSAIAHRPWRNWVQNLQMDYLLQAKCNYFT